jgi:hypothetical protein
VDKWQGSVTACQAIGAVSLFDFERSPEQLVLEGSLKWRQFLTRAKPVTVIMGLSRAQLPCELIHYKDTTTGNFIHEVEVCHCGTIPVSAITTHLLVSASNDSIFQKFSHPITPSQLAEVETAYAALWAQTRAQRERQRQADLARLYDRRRSRRLPPPPDSL